MSPRQKHAMANLVVVGVDSGPHSLAAWDRALRMFPGDSTHFHIVHVRPVQTDFGNASLLSYLSPTTPTYTPVATTPSTTPAPPPSHTPNAPKPEAEIVDEPSPPSLEVQDYWDELEGLRRAQCQAVLDRFRQLACHAGISFTLVELQGDAREELCDYCSMHGAQVLVLGSRGGTFLQRLFLGSVSQYCLHNAPCAVMVDRCNSEEPEGVEPAPVPGPVAAAGS